MSFKWLQIITIQLSKLLKHLKIFVYKSAILLFYIYLFPMLHFVLLETMAVDIIRYPLISQI